MSVLKGIRWGWVLLGGFLAELAVFILVIPLFLWLGGDFGGMAGGFVAGKQTRTSGASDVARAA